METEDEQIEALSVEEVLMQVIDDMTREFHIFRRMRESEERNSQNHDIHHFCGGGHDFGL
jgi:hypothetical protein